MSHAKKNKQFLPKHSSKQTDALIAFWIIRMLLDLGAHLNMRSFSVRDNCSVSRIVKATGVSGTTDNETDEDTFYALLEKQGEKLKGETKSLPAYLARNVGYLQSLLNLNPTERELLAFIFMLHTTPSLSDAADKLGPMDTDGAMRALAVIVDRPLKKVRKALHRQSMLVRSELILIGSGSGGGLREKVKPLGIIKEVIHDKHKSPLDLISWMCRGGVAAKLDNSDFGFMASTYQMIGEYLEVARSNRESGVNVLIYGEPGIGKTELARSLAANLGALLYEVGIETPSGDPLTPDMRMLSYRFIQQIAGRIPRTLVLFDEIEDVLPNRAVFPFTPSGAEGKAYLNNLLETNPVPSIWVCNHVDEMDKAALRRFDIVLRMDAPPDIIKQKMLESEVRDLPVSKDWIRRTTCRKDVTPGVIARAAKVANALGLTSLSETEAVLDQVLGGTLEALGGKPIGNRKKASTVPYDQAVINADCDLSTLVKGLRETPSARLCIYGPPGTGKTSFAQFVAETLGKPLVSKRASDLFGKYVGQSERNIAAAFRQAKSERSVLLFDEADSFLRNRNQARASWEVTMVNEVLTQMEEFDGLFICSTNLMDQLDGASLRRFDFKIHFDYMTAAQSWSLFENILKQQGIRLEDPHAARRQLEKLSCLTPGDFHTVLRQSSLMAVGVSSQILLEGLQFESKAKEEHTRNRGIGFTANI